MQERAKAAIAVAIEELPISRGCPRLRIRMEAAPILKQYLLHGARVGPDFDATKNSPLEAFEREAPRHPVFQITPMESPQKERSMKEAL